MNPDPTTQPPNEANLHPMVVLQPGERVICDIKRHPIGILLMYAAAVFAIVVVIVLAVLAPNIFSHSMTAGETSDSTVRLIQLGAVVFCILIVLILLIITIVYWQNRWIVTDDSITQITQESLLSRRVSQLSMENLEDVTIDQRGLLQTMFDYGTLRAETAGEKSKFVFAYCPNPKKMARAILEVHENFIHQIRHQPQPVNPVIPINGPNSDQNQAGQYPQNANNTQFQTPQPSQYHPVGISDNTQQTPLEFGGQATPPQQYPPQPPQGYRQPLPPNGENQNPAPTQQNYYPPVVSPAQYGSQPLSPGNSNLPPQYPPTPNPDQNAQGE